MATTYQIITSVTVGSGGASSIDFSSIPQTYNDLVIKLSTRSTWTGNPTWADTQLRPNGSTTNLALRSVFGYGSTVASNTDANVTGGFANNDSTTSNTFSSTEIYIPNYTSSYNKSWYLDTITETNGSNAMQWMAACLWANSSAITSISLVPQGSFKQYSTATLYGIKNS